MRREGTCLVSALSPIVVLHIGDCFIAELGTMIGMGLASKETSSGGIDGPPSVAIMIASGETVKGPPMGSPPPEELMKGKSSSDGGNGILWLRCRLLLL